MAAFGKSLGGGRRTAMREAAPLMVLLTTIAKTYQTVLVDISATGARLEGDDLPPVGAELCVTVEQVKTFATVMWRRDAECGVQFYEPLLQSEVVSVRRRAAKWAGLDPVLSATVDDWVLGLAR